MRQAKRLVLPIKRQVLSSIAWRGGVGLPSLYTLQARAPGTWGQAPHQEVVQSGCWRCQYQLDGNKLAYANSVEAARQESSPQFHVSQVDCVLPNGCRNRCFPEPSQKVSWFFERNRPQETTLKNKILLYWHLCTQWGTCPVRVVPRNESKGIIPLRKLVELSKGSRLDT